MYKYTKYKTNIYSMINIKTYQSFNSDDEYNEKFLPRFINNKPFQFIKNVIDITSLDITSTKKTPSIFYSNDVLNISGVSIPDDAKEFYDVFSSWIDNYIITEPKKLSINIDLNYFSTKSISILFKILKRLEFIPSIEINWSYNDDEIEECGRELSSILKIDFNLVKKVINEHFMINIKTYQSFNRL